MVEEKARAELGMVKPDEILVQVARAALTTLAALPRPPVVRPPALRR